MISLTWILILSITSSYTGMPSSMTSVGPFASERACMAAADAWLKQQEPTSLRTRALCVSQSEKSK